MIEENTYLNEYEYDSRGNITYFYTHGYNENYTVDFYYDENNQMVETIINGTSYDITYSSTGQPNIFLGWKIEYDMKNIKVVKNDDYIFEYEYNANGIRIGKKIKNGDNEENISFVLEGSNIISEVHTGSANYTINYFYDSNNEIIGFTYDGNKYLYLKNLQNDIIGILDSNNNIVVKYYYDGYGRVIKIDDLSYNNLSILES